MKLIYTRIFPVRHVAAFLHLGTLDSTSALRFWAVLNSKFINEKHTKAKNMTSNTAPKGHSMKAKTREQGTSLFDFSEERVSGDSNLSPFCACP